MSAVTISETRNLLLPLDTVLEALVHFDRKGPCLLMHGEVLQAKLVSGSKRGDGIDVALRNSESRVIEWHRFDFATITAAIISFCRAKRIPLPFSGVKSLSLNKDGITFRIENRVSLSRHSDLQEDISGQPLRYAKGYEPYAIVPTTKTEAFV